MTTPATVRPLYPAHATLGEGPVWDEREQVLWWVNIEPGELNRFDPSTGENEIFAILEKLAALHSKGILTDEEFVAKKTELLSRL